MNFEFKVYLPTLERYMYCEELTFAQHLNIIKSIQNGDDVQITRILDNLIKSQPGYTRFKNKLSKIDKICVLLNIYIVSVSSRLELKTGTNVNTSIDLYNILDLITNFEIEYSQTIAITKELEVVLKMPKNISNDQTLDLIIDSVSTIKLYGNTHSMDKLDVNQKTMVINNLPGETLTNIAETMRKNSEKYSISIGEITKGEEIFIGLYDETMFELIKIVFNANLNDQYNMRYILSKHCNMACEFIDSCSPGEATTYYNLLLKDVEEEKRQYEKSNTNEGGRIGSMPDTPV